MKAWTTLFVIGLFLTPAALADDVDDVKAAVLRHYAALNAGDADAYIRSRAPQHSLFSGGGLLSRSTSLEEQQGAFKAGIDAGLKRNVSARHIDVQVYGNTAVATNYTIGTIARPDGSITQVRVQRTAVLIKQGGQWKEVHQHRSRLNIAPPQ